MDMIEYAILALGFQARGIAEVVPNPQITDELLGEAAELLERAAGARHDLPRTPPNAGLPDDDNPEAQRRQLDEVEERLAEGGVYVEVNAGSRRDEFVRAERIDLSRLSVEELLSRVDEATAELRRRDRVGDWEGP